MAHEVSHERWYLKSLKCKENCALSSTSYGTTAASVLTSHYCITVVLLLNCTATKRGATTAVLARASSPKCSMRP
eukprot:11213-Heterococcus_DN1.PRE.3